MRTITIRPISLGDSFEVETGLPECIGESPWTAGSFSLFSPEGVNPAVIHAGVVEVGDSTIVGRVADTANLDPGIWRWRLGVNNDDYQSTAALGVVEIRDPANPMNLTHEERMVPILESLIENKMSGRGDVIQYTIGDRSVGAETLKALRMELQRVKQILRFRQGRQTRTLV